MKKKFYSGILHVCGDLLVVLSLSIFSLALGGFCYAQGSIDYSFNPGDLGFDSGAGAGGVRTTAVQADGKIIIGGGFIKYNSISVGGIARLHLDGTLDTTFNLGAGANNEVFTTAVQPDGKIIIGGSFTAYNGVSRSCIARLNEDGTLDTTFDPGAGANNTVYATSILPDGKIIIGGSFTSYSGTVIRRIACLYPDGTLDTTFYSGEGANNLVYATAVQSDGKIILGGSFTSYDGTVSNYIARLYPDGTLDTTFNPGSGANYTVRTIAIQPDGKIIIGGLFTSYNGTNRPRIARLNPDGNLDDTFGTSLGANNFIYETTILSNGKIIIGGDFTSYNGNEINRIARLNSDGTLDQSFNPGAGANSIVWSTTVQPDGKIILGGSVSAYNGTVLKGIGRINPDGTIDSNFNPATGADRTVRQIVLQPDGKIIIGGYFASYNGTYMSRIARLNTNGTIDVSFNPGFGVNGLVEAIAMQSDGRIIIGGSFTSYNGIARDFIARLNANGTLDVTFNPGTSANSQVSSIALQPDGKIIIGGMIARLNPDGTLDTSFDPGTGADYGVSTTAVQPDGKIIIGGAFTSYNGNEINRIARLNSDGTLDQSFNPGAGANNNVRTTTVQSDGKIIIGGEFTSYNGIAIDRIARLNTDGTLDVSFMGSVSNGTVESIAVQPDGRIIIVGSFTYSGVSRNIVRLNEDGTLDTSFYPGIGTNNWIYTTALQPDGKIIIGGNFTSYDGTGRNRIARILNCAPAMGIDTQTACNSYAWIDGNTYTESNNKAKYSVLGGAANGCDSVVTLNLTILGNATSIDEQTICKSFTWIDGKTYTDNNNSATYTIAGGAANGCDSILTLDLTILKVDTSIEISGSMLFANAAGATYQWLDCDNGYAAINGEANQSYTPTLTGNYAVAITMEGCTDTSSCYNVKVSSTEVINQEEVLIVYPNPFSSQATLWSALPLYNATLTIENAFGQTVAQMKNVNGQYILILRGNLASGMYFLRMMQDDKMIAIKKVMVAE